ncbi:MAG: hypothetical protein IPP53_10385 [Bacteroidetes bacterium]|nr:hypothetical protein [Bacteroidota bacterium]
MVAVVCGAQLMVAVFVPIAETVTPEGTPQVITQPVVVNVIAEEAVLPTVQYPTTLRL